MLHLIPAPLHRLLYRVAHAVRRRWWRIGSRRGSGVVVVIFDEHDRVMLVRHSYGPPVWSLPGGGIDRGEEPAHAAAREIREELGCGLDDLTAIDVSEERLGGSRDIRHVFAARVAGSPRPDMREIVAAAFFDPAALPDACGRRSRERIRQALAHSQQR